MLTNNQKGILLYKKQEYITKVLDTFMTETERHEQHISKLVNELHISGVISEQLKQEFMQAIVKYQFTIVDILAQCEQLHIRLYDSEDKSYKKRHNAFYRNIETKEQTK